MFQYDAKPDLLQGRTVLVTGAGSGLGRAAALAYARHGASVILLGRREETLEAVYDAIEAENLPEPALMVLDLQRAGEDDYREVAQIVADEFGALHGILHSAGISSPAVPLQFQDLETWNRLIQVNLTAAFGLTRACLPLLQQAEDASVIFTSSRAGRETRAYWGAYCVAKHGIETLMDIWVDELRNTSNIRLNSLNPGPCATSLRRVIFPAENPATLPRPDDLLPLYLYLMGPDSRDENGGRFDAQAPEAYAGRN